MNLYQSFYEEADDSCVGTEDRREKFRCLLPRKLIHWILMSLTIANQTFNISYD